MALIDIERLATRLQALGISACEIHHDAGPSIKLRLGGGPRSTTLQQEPAQTSNVAAAVGMDVVRSPAMGRFYASHPLSDAPVAVAGQSVITNQVVGYLLTRSVISEITTAHAGKLGRALVEEGSVVGFGTPIFKIS
jgi:acetyl-CoA carboxylase biotin carboxyl carrier protein